MAKLFAILVALFLASCTVSHRVTPLEKGRYEVQITHRNAVLDPLFDRDQAVENKAREICPHYRIITRDKTRDLWSNRVTRSIIIECEE